MANNVSIRVTAPGAKQAASDIAGVQRSMGGLAGAGASIKQGMGMAFGLSTVGMVMSAKDALGDFVGDSIKAASSLGETLNKSKVIFGANADEIEAWGDTAAETFGQSQRQAIDTASTFAGLFQTVGMGGDAATDMSKKLTVLGSDLASFFDVENVQDAISALRSGLSGEAEPMRRFNVFLSETAVNAKLLEMGEKKLGAQWSENQKVSARYQLILEQTSAAQGDFARTSDSLANKERELAGTMEDTQAKLGEKLLPAQQALTQAQLDGATAAGNMFDMMSLGNQPLEEQADTLDATADSIRTLFPAFGFLADAIDGAGAAADAATPEVYDLGRGAERAAENAHDLAVELENAGPKIYEGAAGAFSAIPKAWRDVAAKNLEQAVQWGEDFPDAVRGAKEGIEDAMDDLMWAIKHPMAATRRLAKVEGALTSAELAEGLASKNPLIRQAAVNAKAELIEIWTSLTGRAYTEGVQIADAQERGLRTFRPVKITPYMLASGSHGGINPVTGKPWGVRHSGGPVAANTPYIVGKPGAEELFVPSQSGQVLPGRMAAGGGGGGTTNIYLTGPFFGGPAGLDQLTREIAGRLRQTVRGANYQAGRF